jgi:hypothetical protein
MHILLIKTFGHTRFNVLTELERWQWSWPQLFSATSAPVTSYEHNNANLDTAQVFS